MTKLSRFQIDPQRSADGRWFDFESHASKPLDAPHASHLCFLVAWHDNPRFRARQVQLLEQLGNLNGDAVEQYRRCDDRALAEAVLIGWANLEDDDGKAIPYSADEAFRILSAPENAPVRSFVVRCATTLAHYRRQAEEAAAGN